MACLGGEPWVMSAYLRLWSRNLPHWDEAGQAMAQDAFAEVELVFPLDLRHFEQAVDEFNMAGQDGKTRRHFVLDDVPALQKAGAIHRRKPTAHRAEGAERTSDGAEDEFPGPARTRTELCEDFAYQLPVMPLLGFYRLDSLALTWIRDTSPMPGICEPRGKLTRISSLEDTDERLARAGRG